MTDKQIIIDVCPYQGECSVSGCKRNDDGCFVRQLFEERYRAENRIVELNKTIKAKEQECEELKIYIESNEQQVKEVETLVMDNDRLINELDQLKAENEALKKEIEYDSRYNDMQAEIDCGNAIVDKYAKCLTEIKELCQKHIKAEKIVMANDILQKITESEAWNDYVI